MLLPRGWSVIISHSCCTFYFGSLYIFGSIQRVSDDLLEDPNCWIQALPPSTGHPTHRNTLPSSTSYPAQKSHCTGWTWPAGVLITFLQHVPAKPQWLCFRGCKVVCADLYYQNKMDQMEKFHNKRTSLFLQKSEAGLGSNMPWRRHVNCCESISAQTYNKTSLSNDILFHGFRKTKYVVSFMFVLLSVCLDPRCAWYIVVKLQISHKKTLWPIKA